MKSWHHHHFALYTFEMTARFATAGVKGDGYELFCVCCSDDYFLFPLSLFVSHLRLLLRDLTGDKNSIGNIDNQSILDTQRQ